MASNDSETQQVISNLRACLISVKGGIPLSSLDRDYKVLVGQSIPYRKLGFDSLEKFLKSIPDVSMSRTRTGETILDAIPTKNSQHLAALVSKQKAAPKKLRPGRSYPLRRTAASQWRPPPSSSWNTSYRQPSYGKRSPLSVTVNNNTKNQHLDKSDRTVAFSDGHRSFNSNRNSSSQGNRSSQYVFEPPPRFLRMSTQDNMTNKVPYQKQTSQSSSQQHSPAICTDLESPLSSQLHSPGMPPNIMSPGSNVQSSGISSRPQSGLQSAGAQSRLQSPSLPAMNGDVRSATPGSVSSDSMADIFNSLERVRLTQSFPLLKSRNRNRKNPQVPSVIQVESTYLDTLAQCVNKDYGSELRKISKSMGWGEPCFRIVPRVPKGEPVMYGCIVKVGEHSYNSYPDEHIFPGEAVQLAAKLALEDLNRLYDGLGGEDKAFPETLDKNLVMKRVAKIVTKHPNGIWSTQIPLDYKEDYFETLPDDWLKLMGHCSLVTLEFIAGNRIIITPNEPCGDNQLSQRSAYCIQPDPLVFPESQVWDVYVTYVGSTAEVWIRLIGDEHSVLYESMSTDMEMFYMESDNIALNPEVGAFYAIQLDGCWHRVQLEKLEGQAALVCFIDHGDEDVFPVHFLHVLELNFAELPAQAIRCCLSGLEDFCEDPNATVKLVETIIGKTLVAEVVSRGSEEDPTVSLILYDTSTDEDININQSLAEKISQEVNAPQLPEGGDIAEVYISHVSERGELYVQIPSESFNYLETLMRQLTEDGRDEDNLKRASNHNNDPSKLYLGRYPEDMRFYRAQIIESLGPNEVKVLFVDYGNTEVISSSELFMLKELSSTLDNFPHQAIKVGLHNISPESFNLKLVARVRDLIPDTEPVLVKTIEPACGGMLPQVEIFKRIVDDNQLVSINTTLAFDPEFVKPSLKSQSSVDSNTRNKKMFERMRSLNAEQKSSPDLGALSPSSTYSKSSSQSFGFEFGQGDIPARGLSAPQIPDIGSYFDIHVTMAANPSNFTVQPYKERLRMEKMMEVIQEFYKPWPYPIKPPDTVKEGMLYAALHNDGHFYRVCVSNVMSGSLVSVYFCDFGDVAVLSEEKLQPLASQFKELPYQAIKAKLSGIQPSHSDWSVEDCLMFQDRVVEHQFVSVIVERGPDLLNPSDTCLGLQLIDTSGEKDVYIDKLLVKENRAVFTNSQASQ